MPINSYRMSLTNNKHKIPDFPIEKKKKKIVGIFFQAQHFCIITWSSSTLYVSRSARAAVFLVNCATKGCKLSFNQALHIKTIKLIKVSMFILKTKFM